MPTARILPLLSSSRPLRVSTRTSVVKRRESFTTSPICTLSGLLELIERKLKLIPGRGKEFDWLGVGDGVVTGVALAEESVTFGIKGPFDETFHCNFRPLSAHTYLIDLKLCICPFFLQGWPATGCAELETWRELTANSETRTATMLFRRLTIYAGRVPIVNGFEVSAKKSFPLSSTTIKAGKSSTSIFQTASIPNSE